MRSAWMAWVVILVVPVAAEGQDHADHSRHAGETGRQIKALSDDRVADLLAGEGAGYALAAELNQYPGPRHVLDLGMELSLGHDQRERISRIYEEMNERARELGNRLVEAERDLDLLFRDRSATEQGVKVLVSKIGELGAELRYVHLEAHLRTTELLTHDQIRDYDEARGYSHGAHGPHGS
jgi:hypothetical protein